MANLGKLRDRTVPGVYVTELPAFPPSIVGVQTAVPVFIGYTEYATDPTSKQPAYLKAIPLASMADYYNWFGHIYSSKYGVEEVTTAGAPFDFEAVKPKQNPTDPSVIGYYNVVNSETVHFNLFTALKLFYANGGGNCYVISVANYQGKQTTTPDPSQPPTQIQIADLEAGLAVANDQVGPTMLVIPDACLLDNAKYATLTVEQVDQCASLQDRVAILDLQGAMDPTTWTKDGLSAQRDQFYGDISGAGTNVSYATAYAPALKTSILTGSDIDYRNLQATQVESDLLKSLLTQQNDDTYGATGSQHDQVQTQIDLAFGATPPTDPAIIQSTNQYLTNALPLMLQTENILLTKLNVAPPSGVMAGIWTANDSNRGVWNAPANMTCISVIQPEVLLTDADQGSYNVPLNGYAINILRAFVNRGTVVWGARTLDGNSNDYRYIQVRRTLVYIEQSIKTALQPFVFAANDGKTWVTVTGMISDFLTGLWTQGGLMGDKASDAFTVQCGLGTTMTGQDILNGYMVVSVTLQMVHPAEFIELTFTQKMQGVS
ncbi:MAG: phage tail sheath family protein [Proteobacteria bacterium]|nr:phage tail sheath family protein [Pseudomonadota bacterium]